MLRGVVDLIALRPCFFSNWILKHIAVSGCMCDCSITHVDSNVGICAPGCIGVRDSVFLFCFHSGVMFSF